uniref:Uncharacterized protein n=1 Tax=Pseudomonas phage RVTF4 TaxID=3236931 RepID=A0AB39CCG2_9VIRU
MTLPIVLTHPVTLAVIVVVLLVIYYSLQYSSHGSVREWADKDFPEIKHTPKPTWLTGFRFKRHGIETTALLETPIYLEYETEGRLGMFGVADNHAWNVKDKEQTSYDFGVDLDLLAGGQVAVTEKFKKISITEIEPIIEDNADAGAEG